MRPGFSASRPWSCSLCCHGCSPATSSRSSPSCSSSGCSRCRSTSSWATPAWSRSAMPPTSGWARTRARSSCSTSAGPFPWPSWPARCSRPHRRARRLHLHARHRHLLRDAHARVRPAPLHRRLQVARSDGRLRRHRGRAQDHAPLGWPEPRRAPAVLLPRRHVPGARLRGVPRARPLAVRTRARGDPRERAELHEPRPRPRPFKLVVFVVAASFAGLAGALFAPFRGFASPEIDVLGALGPGAHDGRHGRDRHARRSRRSGR